MRQTMWRLRYLWLFLPLKSRPLLFLHSYHLEYASYRYDGLSATAKWLKISHVEKVTFLFHFTFPLLQVAVSPVHSLAVTVDGDLYAWGDNATGCLGFGISGSCAGAVLVSEPAPTPGVYPTPRRVEGALRKVRIVCAAAAASHSLAVGSDGSTWSWGRNSHGQLGLKDATNAVVGGPRADPVAAGARQVYVAWSPVRTDPLPSSETPDSKATGLRVRQRRRIVAGSIIQRSDDYSYSAAVVASQISSSNLAESSCKSAAALTPEPSEPYPGPYPRAPGHLLPTVVTDADMASIPDHVPVVVAAAGAYSLVLTRGGGVFACGNGRTDWYRLHFDMSTAHHNDAVAAYLEAGAELQAMDAPKMTRAAAVKQPLHSIMTPETAAADLAAAGFSVLHYADSDLAVDGAPRSFSASPDDSARQCWSLQKRGKRPLPSRSEPTAAARFGSSFGMSAIIRQISASPSLATAVDSDGGVWTWGSSAELMGHGRVASTGLTPPCDWTQPPRRISSLSRAGVRVVSVNASCHCATATDVLGDLWTWGDSVAAEAGLLGHGIGGCAAIPRRVTSVKGALLAVPGMHHVMVATTLLLPPLPPLLPSASDLAQVVHGVPIGMRLQSSFRALSGRSDVEGVQSDSRCCVFRCGIYGGVVNDLLREADAQSPPTVVVRIGCLGYYKRLHPFTSWVYVSSVDNNRWSNYPLFVKSMSASSGSLYHNVACCARRSWNGGANCSSCSGSILCSNAPRQLRRISYCILSCHRDCCRRENRASASRDERLGNNIVFTGHFGPGGSLCGLAVSLFVAFPCFSFQTTPLRPEVSGKSYRYLSSMQAS